MKAGFEFCSLNDCSPGSANYDNWSTPSRDKASLDFALQIENLSNKNIDLQKHFNATSLKLQIDLFENMSLNLLEIHKIWLDQKYSSDPNNSIHIRWGIPESGILNFN